MPKKKRLLISLLTVRQP